LIFTAPSPVYAAGITVEPLTWNIIGLDSNKPAEGPNHFPVGARVCNDTGGPISSVKADFKWDSTTNSTYIYERPGTATSVTMFDPTEPALANGDCSDIYFEVEVLKFKESYKIHSKDKAVTALVAPMS
jgi:hypothetical protein